MRKLPMFGIAAASLASIAVARRAFMRDMEQIATKLRARSDVAPTASGPIEYARAGEGNPALVIHGAGGGYDQGLFLGQELFAGSAEIIAPSRFGYLRTPVPADASPAAQADAHAALLDTLEIPKAIVVGVSAGAPSAVEMALRHKDRVSALILIVPRLYSPSHEVSADASVSSRTVLKLIMRGADFGFWAAIRLARSSLVRFLGVPPELEAGASPKERQRITEIIRGILPLSARLPGLEVDGTARIEPWPLERIETPTLIVSARDDLYGTLPGARYSAGRIRGAELKVLADGGHLMVGRGNEVRAMIQSFLKRNPFCALRVAA